MSDAGRNRRNARRALTVTVVLAALLLVSVAVTAYFAFGRPTFRSVQPQPPSAAAGPAAVAPADVSWTTVAGVRLPFSRADGPHSVTPTTASGFSHSRRGAGLAAVHVLMRSSPTAGPQTFEPTITQQVAGANVAAMKLLTAEEYAQLRNDAGVAAGQPVDGDAQILGYRTEAFAGATASESVLLASPALQAKGQVLRVDVRLQWAAGDWRVVAPPRGDWAASTSVLSATPDGVLQYDEGP
jgi:hypothetical protein